MKKDSGSGKFCLPCEAIEAALLLIVFVIAGLFWPPRDLLEEE
jgi:hypothetical protein